MLLLRLCLQTRDMLRSHTSLGMAGRNVNHWSSLASPSLLILKVPRTMSLPKPKYNLQPEVGVLVA